MAGRAWVCERDRSGAPVASLLGLSVKMEEGGGRKGGGEQQKVEQAKSAVKFAKAKVRRCASNAAVNATVARSNAVTSRASLMSVSDAICRCEALSDADEATFLSSFDASAEAGMGVKHPNTNEWMIHTARIQEFLDQCKTGAVEMVIETAKELGRLIDLAVYDPQDFRIIDAES